MISIILALMCGAIGGTMLLFLFCSLYLSHEEYEESNKEDRK